MGTGRSLSIERPHFSVNNCCNGVVDEISEATTTAATSVVSVSTSTALGALAVRPLRRAAAARVDPGVVARDSPIGGKLRGLGWNATVATTERLCG